MGCVTGATRWGSRGRVAVALVLAVAVVVIGALGQGAAAQPPVAVDAGAVDRFVAAAMRDNGIPGLAVAITHGDRVVYLKGHGRAGDGRPITPRTQFRIASLSKSFTALAVLQLAEAGQIALDTPVRAYLPEFTVADPEASRRITVRHLLNQTSGLADAGFAEGSLPPARSARQRVANLRAAHPVSPPGAEFHYTDPNYGVLARLVEVVSGQGFGEYLRQHVFGPLRMPDTTSVVTAGQADDLAPDLAQGHIIAFGRPIARSLPDGVMVGSSGVISTAADMANALIMHSQQGRFEGRSLVGAEAAATMQTSPAGIDSSYAMGWTVPDAATPPRLEHNGVLSTFYAEQVLLPASGHGIVLLANAYSALANLASIKQGLIALALGQPPGGGGWSARTMGLALAILTLGVVILRVRSLIRLGSWAAKRHHTAWWRLIPGLVWPLLPIVVLAALPALTTRLIGRAFTHTQLLLALPDVAVWLGTAALLGVVLVVARVVTLTRRATRPSMPPPAADRCG